MHSDWIHYCVSASECLAHAADAHYLLTATGHPKMQDVAVLLGLIGLTRSYFLVPVSAAVQHASAATGHLHSHTLCDALHAGSAT